MNNNIINYNNFVDSQSLQVALVSHHACCPPPSAVKTSHDRWHPSATMPVALILDLTRQVAPISHHACCPPPGSHTTGGTRQPPRMLPSSISREDLTR